LIDYLKSGALPVPAAVSSPPKKADGLGLLSPSFAEGSLLLKDPAGKYARLIWNRDDAKAADRRRGVVPGSYQLTGYHIVRRDKQDKEWFLWVNLRAGRALDIKAGELSVPADDTITINCKTKRTPDGLDIHAIVMADHHAGVTMYKEGKRIPIRYRVTSKNNQALAAGALDYG
jgi:hypothetical protein